MAQARPRGYTLLELMVVVGMASILGTTFCSVMYYQVLTYMERLDEVDAHQSARAAFNVVRRAIQGARYGMAQNINAKGVPGIGRCGATSGTGSQGNCTAQDGNSDRMRVIGIVPDRNFIGAPSYPSAGPCDGTGAPTDATRINVTQDPNFPFAATPLPQLLVIGGNCSDGNAAGNDVLIYGSDAGAANGCSHRYNFTFLEPASGLACPTGYASSFGFGTGRVSDFYIYPDSLNPNARNLMVRSDPRVPLSAGDVVAFNVQRFNVTYQIDTTTPPDRRADVSCADPRSAADGGSCNLTDSQGNLLTTQQNYNRIVGVLVSLQVQSNTYRANLPGSTNGYRTWTYTSTFSLRNNGI
jgi:prepilin-type N-terminal cleavage/methylation domain-containing protein